MLKLTDDLIMAYVDGELDQKQADKVRETLTKDPEAQKRVEIFKRSAAMLQGLYDAPLHEAVPERLIKAVKGSHSDKPSLRIRDFLITLLRIPGGSPVYAMALLAVLICGITTGYLLSNLTLSPNDSSPLMLGGKAFSQALDTTISGQSVVLSGQSLQLTPVATFRDNEKRYCRQYEVLTIQNKKKDSAEGIACRDSNGNWQTHIQTIITPFDIPLPEKSKGYIPAAGQDEVFDVVVDRFMVSPPLTLEQEAALIRTSWN